MDYTNLGRSGLRVSRICLGCMSFGRSGRGHHNWTLDEDEARPVVRRGLELGINFFDTANGYAEGTSEEITGKLLNEMARRDEIVLATKGFIPWRGAPNTGGLSRKALFQAIDDSLKRLGTDYVDLYQIHRWDPMTPIAETMESLHDIVKAGKALHIGASSMAAWQFAKAQHVAQQNSWTPFVSMQPQINLIYREEEREMLPFCLDSGVGVIPWSPLARGKLARPWEEKTARSENDAFAKALYDASAENDRTIVEAVIAIAAERAIPPAQVALAWLLQKPGITAPIVGPTKLAHLEDAAAATAVTLTDAELSRLEEPYTPHPIAGVDVPLRQDGTVSVLGEA